MEKEIFTLIGILFMLASYSIYIFSIYKGQTRIVINGHLFYLSPPYLYGLLHKPHYGLFF